MPSSNKVVKSAFTHGEGEEPGKREYGIRLRNTSGKVSISVRRTAGSAEGTLTVFETDTTSGENKTRLNGKSWGNESTDIANDVTISSKFLILEADFKDDKFGQVEVEIIN